MLLKPLLELNAIQVFYFFHIVDVVEFDSCTHHHPQYGHHVGFIFNPILNMFSITICDYDCLMFSCVGLIGFICYSNC